MNAVHTNTTARLPRRPSDDEFHFANEEALCTFLTTEIIRSRKSYKALAEQAHCCASTVSKMALGETRFPRLATVFNLLAALGFEVMVTK